MNEIDPEIGASWRAASREQPPAALDDALRAAARREVGAKPARVRAAPRWWPLAAAATVAAVAVGIVQMTPPEQVTPSALPAAADVARQAAKVETSNATTSALKRDEVLAALPGSQRDALREVPKPEVKEQRNRTSDEKTPSADAAGRFAAAPEAQIREKKAERPAPASGLGADEASEREQASKQKTELAAASSVARQSLNAASAPAASAPRNEVVPFPASPAPAQASSNAPAPMIAATPPAAPAASAAPAPLPPALAARRLAAQPAEAGAPSSAISGSAASGVASSRADAGSAEPARIQDSAALGKVASAESDKVAQERRKDAPPLAPDEWIKRIRRLIAEGRNDDAAKELVAFRREYKERSDALLPSELRTFRP